MVTYYRLDFDLNVDDKLESITNVISSLSDNPQPAQQKINYDMMEMSYQEALVEHHRKKIKKEQGCHDKETSEVKRGRRFGRSHRAIDVPLLINTL